MTPDPDLLPARADSRSDDALLAFAETALTIEGIVLEQRSLRQIARTVGRLRPAADQVEQSNQTGRPTTVLPPAPAGPEVLDAAFAALLQACQ